MIFPKVHHGDAIEAENLGWHTDSFNSVCHLAIALHGRRALHSRLANHPTEGQFEEHVEWFEPGDVYLSSPSSFSHSVEYPQCDWASRVVAIQCRLLLTQTEYSDLMSAMDVKSNQARENALVGFSKVLNTNDTKTNQSQIVIPTLEQVVKEYERLCIELQEERTQNKSNIYSCAIS